MELIILLLMFIGLGYIISTCKDHQIPSLGWIGGVLGVVSLGILTIALLGLLQGLL
jgi:hypothetical protein